MAKSISVAVGESETIALGCLSIVTVPDAPWTVTGYAAALVPAADVGDVGPLDVPVLELEQAARAPTATSTSGTDLSRDGR
jgi:hypothetical protein